jgi:hypothetical protein
MLNAIRSRNIRERWTSARRDTAPVIQINLRHGIWRIWLDGKFFGDYRSKSQALEAAEAAQRAMATIGRMGDVVVKPETSLA